LAEIRIGTETAKKFTSKVSCRIADETALVRLTRAAPEGFSCSIKTVAY
jgi:hypothetical protein